MKRKNNIFNYDNIYFENGIKDKDKHPVIIAGSDDENFYCFMMTSKLKHTGKNSFARNTYNENIYYVKTIPGKNCIINNETKGLIITSHCFKVPITSAEKYKKFGIVKPEVTKEVITKWAYQQNEIKDKPVHNYNQICKALGIDDSIKQSELYNFCIALMKNYPEELSIQKDYAKKLRIHNEKCKMISKENINRHKNNLPILKYSEPPKLPDNKEIINQYIFKTDNELNNTASYFKKFYETKTKDKSNNKSIITKQQYEQQETHHRRAA